MNIHINGAARAVPQNSTLSALLEQLNLSGKRVAIELNGEIVPRSTYAQTRLSESDRLEIVQAIGGG
jgi:sulfur carrier protein